MITEVMTWLREQIAETQRSTLPLEVRAMCQAHTEIVDRHKPVQLDLPHHGGYSCEGCGADLWRCPGGLCPDVLSLVRAYSTVSDTDRSGGRESARHHERATDYR